MKYNIGQVLYVLLNKETKICPVQVVEEITKKSLEGESTIYIVRFGKKGDTVDLSTLDGQVFESIDMLRSTLHERITRTVNAVIDGTMKRAQEWYQHHEQPRHRVVEEHPHVESFSQDLDDAIITLPDGTVAKVRSSIPGM